MNRKIGMIIVILVICGVAFIAVQHLRFLERTMFVFNAPPAGAKGHLGTEMRPGAERTGGAAANETPTRPQHAGPPPGKMGTTMLWQGWLNILAYLAVWAFLVMGTYYVETGIHKLVRRTPQCTESSVNPADTCSVPISET